MVHGRTMVDHGRTMVEPWSTMVDHGRPWSTMGRPSRIIFHLVVAHTFEDAPDRVITDGLFGGFVDCLPWEADPHLLIDHGRPWYHGLCLNATNVRN